MKFIYFNQKYFSNKPSYQEDNRVLLIPEPWLIYKNRIGRLLCHISLSPKYNSRIKIPMHRWWIRDILKRTKMEDEEVTIIINAHFYHLVYSNIKNIARQYFPSVKLVFIFSDKVEYFKKNYSDFPSIEELKNCCELVVTYNVEDSKKFNILLDRPCFPQYYNMSDILNEYTSDLFFVGANKGRINQLHTIFEYCEQRGIKCDFHITDVPTDEQLYKGKIIYNCPMEYSEVLERVSKTKCILNIIQNGGSGITLRDYEAISFNKLELTNNVALKETGLYSKEQVIWLEELSNRISDISIGYTGENGFRKEFSQSRWFDWLEEKLSCKEIYN